MISGLSWDLYRARRLAALAVSVLLVELGCGNDVVWPSEPDGGAERVDAPDTVGESVSGDLSVSFDGSCFDRPGTVTP